MDSKVVQLKITSSSPSFERSFQVKTYQIHCGHILGVISDRVPPFAYDEVLLK
jgi:hypothetical protein